MRPTLRVILFTCAAIILHLLLGWMWTVVAAFAAGFSFRRLGWLAGAVVVGLDYLLLTVYSYVVDPRAFGVMVDTLASLLGNLPSFSIVAITLLIGLLIGALGGAAGYHAGRLVRRRQRH